MYLRLRLMIKWLLAYVWKDISKTRRWDCFRICTTSWQLSGDIRAYFAVLPFPLAAVSSTPVSLPSVPLSPMLLVLPPTLQQQRLLLSPLISWPLPVLAPQPSQQLPFHSQQTSGAVLLRILAACSTRSAVSVLLPEQPWLLNEIGTKNKTPTSTTRNMRVYTTRVCLCVCGGGRVYNVQFVNVLQIELSPYEITELKQASMTPLVQQSPVPASSSRFPAWKRLDHVCCRYMI